MDHDRAFVNAAATVYAQSSPTIWQRGLVYEAEGRVTHLQRTTPTSFTAVIVGKEPYRVEIYVNPFHTVCECPAFADRGVCKHIVALSIAINKRMTGAPNKRPILTGAIRRMLNDVRLSPIDTRDAREFPAVTTAAQAPFTFAGVDVPLLDVLTDPTGIAERHSFDGVALAQALAPHSTNIRTLLENERRARAQEQQRKWRAQQRATIEALASEPLKRFALLALAERETSAPLRDAYDIVADVIGTREPKLVIPQGWLALDSWRGGKLVAHAHYDATRARATLLELALAIICDSADPLHEALRASIERDPTDALLSGLDELLTGPIAPPRQPDHVLSWRFALRDHTFQLDPFVHKPTKKGFSVGALYRGYEPVLPLRQDELALARPDPVGRVQALAGHPRVFAHNDVQTPVAVRRGEVSVRTVDVGDDVELRIVLDEAPISFVHESVAVAITPTVLSFATLDPFQLRLYRHLSQAPAVVPATAKAALVERMVALEKRVAVGLSHSMRGDQRPARIDLVARFFAVGPDLALELLIEPLGDGLAFVPGHGQREVSRIVDGARVYAERDFDAETAAADAVWIALQLPPATDYTTPPLAHDDLLDLLVLLRDQPVRIDWPKQRPKPFIAKLNAMSQVHLVIKQERGWFELSGSVTLDNEQVDLARVALAVRERKKYVTLDDGRFMTIANELRAPLERLALTHGDKLSLAGAHAIAELAEAGAHYEAHADYAKLVERIRHSPERVHAVPARLEATLRPYQQDGFAWLARLADWGIGGVLADDMGLGKTLQAIALLLHRSKDGPALVVCPTSVVFNWVRELERFAPSLKVFETVSKKVRAGQVVIMSYGAMTRDVAALPPFTTVIFDEAHALKNPEALRTRAARQLKAELVIALSGTPIENRLGELWSLFRVVAPGLLGNAETFRSRFILPIEQKRDAHARHILSQILSPFILRRTKAMVAPELPPKVEVNVGIDLGPVELALYEALRTKLVETLRRGKPDQRARIAMLAAITELRLAACDPRFIDEDAPAGSKLTELLRLIAELRDNGHRVLVFSQFTRYLDLIQAELADVPLQRLDGTTPAATRKLRVDAFERGEGDVFLLSLQAGGTGLNLTSADYVIIVDPWWNPAVEDQATGRAHRIGQTKPVTVYRLFSRHTIEEKILSMHAEKRELVAAVMDNASSVPTTMSGEDLMRLMEASIQ